MTVTTDDFDDETPQDETPEDTTPEEDHFMTEQRLPGDLFAPPAPLIDLVVSGRSRMYRVTTEAGTTVLPSVTTLLRAVNKPALPNWAAKAAAEFAVANIETVATLAAVDTDAATDLVKGAPWRDRDRAASLGSRVHALIATGAKAAADEAPYVEAYGEWHAGFAGVMFGHETPVASLAHGWAGTADLIGADGVPTVYDVKTSRTVADRDGNLYPEMRLQLAAYAVCEVGPTADVRPTRGVVLHVRPEGCVPHVAFDGAAELAGLVAVMDAVRVLAGFIGMAEVTS